MVPERLRATTVVASIATVAIGCAAIWGVEEGELTSDGLDGGSGASGVGGTAGVAGTGAAGSSGTTDGGGAGGTSSCPSGSADCSAEPGCETDTDNDPANCGSCGFTCPYYACEEGSCVVVDSVAAGGNQTCAVLTNTGLLCWGSNSDGQLALDPSPPTNAYRTEPEWIDLPLGATAVAVGTSHVCTVLDDEKVWCWGRNTMGELGRAVSATDPWTPQAVSTVGGASNVGLGSSFTFAIVSGETAMSWGANEVGELGQGHSDTGPEPIPRPVVDITNVTSIAGGAHHGCAVADGIANCWGDNADGQVGSGSSGIHTRPTAVTTECCSTELGDVVQIAAGFRSSCAVVRPTGGEGRAWCWGQNSWFIGQNWYEYHHQAVQLDVPSVQQVDTGRLHTCMLLTDGTVQCRGSNSTGQLGNNNVEADPDGGPAEVRVQTTTGILDEVKQIAAGDHHTCAVQNDGILWCWGRNAEGQLGNGVTSNSPIAVEVTFDSSL